MVASDWIAITQGVITVLATLVAFLEALYPPETRRAKQCWIAVVAGLTLMGIVLVVANVQTSAKERTESVREQQQREEKLQTLLKEMPDLVADKVSSRSTREEVKAAIRSVI